MRSNKDIQGILVVDEEIKLQLFDDDLRSFFENAVSDCIFKE